MYNQHTRGMATTRHRSLVGRSGGRGFVRDRPSTKKNSAHRYLKSKKKRFEQIQLQAKLLDYFLGSNKSNINQCVHLLIDGVPAMLCVPGYGEQEFHVVCDA